MPLLAHFGMGFAAKAVDPRIPTWILVVSALLIDILAGLLFLLSWLWFTHGMLMAIVWTLIAMGITWIVVSRYNKRQSADNKDFIIFPVKRTTLLIGLLVFSHWILDAIGWPMVMYNPDSPGVPILFDNTYTIGLGVYRTWTGAVVMELGFLLLGLVLFFKFKNQKKNG